QLEAAPPEPVRPAREAAPATAEAAQPATGGRAAEAPGAAAPAAAPPEAAAAPRQAGAAPRAGAPAPREAAPAASRPEPEPRAAAPQPEQKPARRAEAAESAAERIEPVGNDLDAAFALLRRATQDAQRASGGSVARDSDVKRRLLELDPAWDESNLGFSKFSRFLRRAHDEDVITLNRLDNGNYEVAAGAVDVAEEPRGRRGRGRSGGRAAAESAAPTREERPAAKDRQEQPAAAPAPSKTSETKAQPAAAAAESKAGGKQAPAAASPSKPAPSAQSSMFDESTAAPASRPAQTIGLRRGSRSRGGVPSGPPPLFEGQALNVAGGKQAPAAQQPAAAADAGKAAAQETGGVPAWFPTGSDPVIGHL